MSETHTEEAQLASRRKRVQRLKKIIIITLMIAILIPIILSIFLLIKTIRLEKEIEELKQMMTLESAEESAIDREETAEDVEAVQMETSGTEPSGIELRIESEEAESAAESEITEEEDIEESTEEESTEEVKTRKVYLTFDDGPSVYTEEILDILKEYDVKATFFVVGKEGEKYEALYRRIVEEGHTLGMHSYSHRYDEIYASEENFAEDFEKIQTYLYDITGVESRFYRFPGGSSNTVSKIDMSNFIDYLQEQDVVYFDWNVSSGDASSGGVSVEQIIDNCVGNVGYYNNMVILMHDSQEKRTTVDALPSVIERLLSYENTQIVPITDDTEPVQHRKN